MLLEMPAPSRSLSQSHHSREAHTRLTAAVMGVNIKRVVLNPRSYLTPFLITVVFHHLPMVLAFALIDKPDEYEQCHRLKRLFGWLDVSFGLHVALMVVALADIALTLSLRVYRTKRPENAFILLVFALYLTNLGWTIYGEADFPEDMTPCGASDSETVQDRADSICYFQHFDFVFTCVLVCLGGCTSYMCGVHTSDDIAEAELRWQRRCTLMFRAFTCKSGVTTGDDTGDDDIFRSLGMVLGKFFVVKYNANRYEGLAVNDLMFALDLVAKKQKTEREQAAAHEVRRRFPAEIERKTLEDLDFYGKQAVGIYGWPVYVWYSPCNWYRIFNCLSKRKDDEQQVIDHDNAMQANRASFVQYTGVRRESLVYLNCYNFVFQAPYSIVKDVARKELIISVRGSLSFYDFVTDGLAQIVRMDPEELPEDIPDADRTYTHYGMLRTARSLFRDLQEGTRKDLFWDFAMAHCATNATALGGSLGVRDWNIVVCGHSMGAGAGAILSVLLRKVFPKTRAFLYAVPMLFDAETAEWTKAFMTTVVYNDDVVPRLSLANVARLRDEMTDAYSSVAEERLFNVRYGRKGKKIDAPPSSNADTVTSSPPTSNVTMATLATESPPESSASQNELPGELMVVDPSHVDVHVVGQTSAVNDAQAIGEGESEAPRRSSMAMSPTGVFQADYLRESFVDSNQEVDVPGVIVHVETVKKTRLCGCTAFMGNQDLHYTLRDASYFRRIWATARAVPDHMVHHYDRDITHLVEKCVDFTSMPAEPTAATAIATTTVTASDGASKQQVVGDQSMTWTESTDIPYTAYKEEEHDVV